MLLSFCQVEQKTISGTNEPQRCCRFFKLSDGRSAGRAVPLLRRRNNGYGAETREVMMMKWTLPVPFVALAALAVVMVPAAAQAQSQRQTAAPRPSQHTVFTSRDETGRTHTRIIVTPRSYLDGGTEVLPGQRKYSDYAIPP